MALTSNPMQALVRDIAHGARRQQPQQRPEEDAWMPRSIAKMLFTPSAAAMPAPAPVRCKPAPARRQPVIVAQDPAEVQSFFDLLPFQTQSSGGGGAAASPPSRRRAPAGKTHHVASTNTNTTAIASRTKAVVKFFRLVQDVARPAIVEGGEASAVFADLRSRASFGSELIKYLHASHVVQGATATATTTTTCAESAGRAMRTAALAEAQQRDAHGALRPHHILQHYMLQNAHAPYQPAVASAASSAATGTAEKAATAQHSGARMLGAMLNEGTLEILRSPNAGGNSILSEALAFEFAAREWGARLLHTEMELRYFPAGGSMLDFTAVLPSERCILAVSVTRAMVYAKSASASSATCATGRVRRRNRRRRRNSSNAAAVDSEASDSSASMDEDDAEDGSTNDDGDNDDEMEEDEDMLMMEGTPEAAEEEGKENAWGMFSIPAEPARNARFERAHARTLLNKKLCGLQYAVRNVMIPAMKSGSGAGAGATATAAGEDMSEWPIRPVLFIWCMSEQAANTVAKIYSRMSREVRGDALVYLVAAADCPWLFWNLRRAKS